MTNGLTALDVMVLLSVGVSAAFGGLRGFVSEVFSLAAWFAGFVAVKLFQEPAAAFLVGPVGTWGGANVMSVALVFGIAFLAVRVIGNALGQRTRKSLLGPVDRVLGVGFGALKGLLAATLAFLLMTLVFDTINGAKAPRPEWMTKSRTYELLRASSVALVDAVEAGRGR
jgi:membrane protein required for colicin V production